MIHSINASRKTPFVCQKKKQNKNKNKKEYVPGVIPSILCEKVLKILTPCSAGEPANVQARTACIDKSGITSPTSIVQIATEIGVTTPIASTPVRTPLSSVAIMVSRHLAQSIARITVKLQDRWRWLWMVLRRSSKGIPSRARERERGRERDVKVALQHGQC